MQKFDDGEISTAQSSKNKIHIVKRGNQIQMYFSDGDKFSGIMSRIDLIHPLKLLGLYTQAIMISLAFVENPKKIYMIGFGGGRIPMIFHHYFPDVIVESTEDDSEVISLAHKYFGVNEDNRMIVHNQDGRGFLENRESNGNYDIIIIDSFTGAGLHPFSLSSTEFYQTCKIHSSDRSVVVTNLVESDPLFGSKVNTFINSFNFVYEFFDDGTHVFFGSDSINISNEEIVSKAKAIDDYYNFRFPLDKLSEMVRVLKSIDIIQNELYKGEILRDRKNQIFKASRNDLCPCGSGKKFKKCHLLLNKI